jgi:SNF2 family DNA or RNA helicase
LEILDPQRFCRGVAIESVKQLEPVMVRRLKDDLRKLEGGFPVREVVEVPVDGLATDNPELVLPQLLDEYRQAREERLKAAAKSTQVASALVLCSLQKRLLSSIEAFACTLSVHRDAFETQAKKAEEGARSISVDARAIAQLQFLTSTPDADDDRAEASEDDLKKEDDAAIATATAKVATADIGTSLDRERGLLARMTELANSSRSLPDARVKHLIKWARAHKNQRVLIFTEYADTKRYLEKQLRAALTPGRDSDPSIATFHGGMPEDAREEVKRAFNAELSDHPLRILIATDAAREGVNLQNNCADLFHFDVPWNPSRLEQRNGRIDRKLQRSPEVRCHYFVYEQRPEDRVLKALVQKTKTIRRELGSLAPVVERRLEDRLTTGFARRDVKRLTEAIDSERVDPDREKAVQIELEAGRKRDRALKEQIEALQDLLKKSRDWLHIDKDDLRQAISCGLELLGAKPLQREPGSDEFRLPEVVSRLQNDPSWLNTLDTLRPPRMRTM